MMKLLCVIFLGIIACVLFPPLIAVLGGFGFLAIVFFPIILIAWLFRSSRKQKEKKLQKKLAKAQLEWLENQKATRH